MQKILDVDFVTSVYPGLRRVMFHRMGGIYKIYLPTKASRNRLWQLLRPFDFQVEPVSLIATHLYFKIRESK